ncbi:MAG TPA: SRPBCC family protein [Rhizomicrobium sp.]|nr:SRPBCC family protein [Rhizomicrobium sp.]
MSDKFVYVTYIKTTPEKLWDALTKPEFTKQYWFGVTLECDWKAGSPWKMMYDDGRVTDQGEIVEADKPKRIVIKWRNEFMPELKEEGWSRCEMALEPVNDTVKLTITHTIDKIGSKFIQAVSGGWPRILSSLKTMLETGAPLPSTK